MVDIEKAQAAVRLLLEALGEESRARWISRNAEKSSRKCTPSFWQAMKKRLKRI